MHLAKRDYLAIITARSGSKRLKDKNILDLCGKPMFIWSVLAGLHCNKINETVVSTDSEYYQKLAIFYGASCPSLRSQHLSQDCSTSVDVVTDVVRSLKSSGKFYENIVLLQPTSPLRTANDVCDAISCYEKLSCDSLVSVSRSECNPNLISTLTDENLLDRFIPKLDAKETSGSDFYRINGAIYIIKTELFLERKTFLPKGTQAYVMARFNSVDVDTDFDFKISELIMRQGLNYNY
jgi:CMP-N,N'-diacetyllegionaminic acid synthase